METLSEVFEKKRKDKLMNKKDFAIWLGMTPSQYSIMINKNKAPLMKNLKRLCKRARIKLEDIKEVI